MLELFAVMDVGYLLTHPDGTILQVNESTTRLFKRSQGALLSRSIFPLLASKHQFIQRSVSQLKPNRGSEDWELLLRRAKESPFPALVRAVAEYDPADKAKYIHWLVCDLTEQKAIQKAKERAEFLAAASDQLSVDFDLPATVERITRLAVPAFADVCYVHVRDREGKLIQFGVSHTDPAQEAKLMEQERQHQLKIQKGLVSPKLLPTHKRTFSMRVTNELLQDLAYANDHLRILQRMGLVSFMSVPLKAHGQTYGAIAFGLSGSDRTYERDDLTHAEEFARRAAVAIENALRLEQVQKTILQREQAILLALQEVKLPLNVILHAVEWVEQFPKNGAPASAALYGKLDEISHSAERIRRVVNNIGELTRLQSETQLLTLEWINLTHLVAVVSDGMRLLQRDGHYRKGIQLELNIPPSPQIHVRADELLIRQVLVNLLDNAFKYSSRGVIKVQLGVEPNVQDPRRVQAHLVIWDEGIGVPIAEQEQIFEPFRRARNTAGRNIAGLGMGLALAREIIVRHQGQIWVESPGVDQGSAFHIVLPEVELEPE
jgi:signal transduction histidine kinase